MTDSWITPPWIYDLFPRYLDPCPLDCPEDQLDDLEGTWDTTDQFDGIFINPPYSNVTPWIDKAIRTRQVSAVPIVFLLNHDCSTKWFSKLHCNGARFLMISGRLNFSGEGMSKSGKACNPRPSVLVVLP